MRTTAPTPGLGDVGTGMPTWVQADGLNAADAKRTTWSWVFDASAVTGSTAVLFDPATMQPCASPCTVQFPYFVPDKTGTYTLKETDSTGGSPVVKTLTVQAGNWLGILDSSTSQQPSCMGCHNGQPLPGGTIPVPDKFTPWKNTAHYSSMQWASGPHAQTDLAVEATVESRGTTAAHCGRCHSAQGYVKFTKQLAIGNSGLLTKDGLPPSPTNAADIPFLTSIGLTAAEVEPQTCTACHDPHANPVQGFDCTIAANIGDSRCAQLRVFELAALDATIGTKVLELINAAIVANGSYAVRAYDENTDEYSSNTTSNVALTAPPVSVAGVEVHGQSSFIFTLAAPITINWVTAGTPGGTTTTATFQVQAGTLMTGTPLAAIIPAGGILNKSIWNYRLLNGDGTKGVHNLPFYQQVIGSTNTQLSTL